MLSTLLSGQTLSLQRPQRPPRAAGATTAPSGSNFQITTRTMWGAIQSSPYTFTLTTSGGSGSITWTLTNGSLPAGLALDSATGQISGTPTGAGTAALTFRALDAVAQMATATLVLVVSPNDSNYGNVGDPLADENGVSDPNATLLTSCQTSLLGPNKSYRVTQNIAAASAGAECLRLTRGVKLNLGGNTVTGRITFNDDASGLVIFNGTHNCTWADSGGDAGCMKILSTQTPTAPLRLHHLTLQNSAQQARALHIDWGAPAKVNGVTIKLTNLTINVPSQPAAARSYAISILGGRHNVEAANNLITCVADARACQAIMCFGTADCRMHHNRIILTQNTTDETSRGLLFDGGVEGGEAFNNTLTANNNRGIRIRDSAHIRIHRNNFLNITETGSLATIHLGDPDGTAVNDLDVLVDNNTFEAAGGKMIFIRGAINATVSNNVVTCVGGGACSTSLFATVRAATKTELRLENNPGALLSLPPEQIFVEQGTKIFLCNSGNAFGAGTVVQVSCPP